MQVIKYTYYQKAMVIVSNIVTMNCNRIEQRKLNGREQKQRLRIRPGSTPQEIIKSPSNNNIMEGQIGGCRNCFTRERKSCVIFFIIIFYQHQLLRGILLFLLDLPDSFLLIIQPCRLSVIGTSFLPFVILPFLLLGYLYKTKSWPTTYYDIYFKSKSQWD